jgi:hypothetical protein
MSIFIQIFPTNHSFIQSLRGKSELQTNYVFKFHIPKTGSASLSFTLFLQDSKRTEIGGLIVPLQFFQKNAVNSHVFEMNVLKKQYSPIYLFSTFHFIKKEKTNL